MNATMPCNVAMWRCLGANVLYGERSCDCVWTESMSVQSSAGYPGYCAHLVHVKSTISVCLFLVVSYKVVSFHSFVSEPCVFVFISFVFFAPRRFFFITHYLSGALTPPFSFITSIILEFSPTIKPVLSGNWRNDQK